MSTTSALPTGHALHGFVMSRFVNYMDLRWTQLTFGLLISTDFSHVENASRPSASKRPLFAPPWLIGMHHQTHPSHKEDAIESPRSWTSTKARCIRCSKWSLRWNRLVRQVKLSTVPMAASDFQRNHGSRQKNPHTGPRARCAQSDFDRQKELYSSLACQLEAV